MLSFLFRMWTLPPSLLDLVCRPCLACGSYAHLPGGQALCALRHDGRVDAAPLDYG